VFNPCVSLALQNEAGSHEWEKNITAIILPKSFDDLRNCPAAAEY
jgi:hypothetical protein